MECSARDLKSPKMANFHEFLKNREEGFISDHDAQISFLKMKFNKKPVQELSLSALNSYDIKDVLFITAGEHDQSILGMWNQDVEYRPRYIVGEQPFVFTRNYTCAKFREMYYRVVDMCQGPPGTVIFMHKHPHFDTGYFLYLDKRNTDEYYTRNHLSGGLLGDGAIPYYSCCTMTSGSYSFAVGALNSVLLFNDIEDFESHAINGEVKSVTFNQTSNLLMAGVNTGVLYLMDVRTLNPEADIQVSTKQLMDTVSVNQDHAIIADDENTLVKVDFRMGRVCTTFNGHKHSGNKCPLSWANNMLCATGTDNVIRLWDVSGGNPIHEINPRGDEQTKIRGWLNSHGNKTYLNYFEGEYHVVYVIKDYIHY